MPIRSNPFAGYDRISPSVRRTPGVRINPGIDFRQLAMMQQEEEEPDPYESIFGRYREILSGPQPALDRYREFSRNIPERQKPGFWHTLGAALQGFGASGGKDPMAALQVFNQVQDRPYERALERFGIERELLGEEAQFEAADRKNRLSGLELELDAFDKADTRRRQWFDSESQHGRRQTQNKFDEARIGDMNFDNELAMNRFDWDQDKFLNYDHPLAQRNTRVQERFAGTGERNADTNARRLDETIRNNTERNALDWDIFYQDKFNPNFRGRNQNSNSSFIVPSQERDARSSAVQDLLADPDFSDLVDRYIDIEVQGSPWKNNLDPNDPEFADFKEALDRLTQMRLNRRRQ